MAAWDISPSGVRGVLAATRQVGSEFADHDASLSADLTGGAAEAGSDPIASALTGWSDVSSTRALNRIPTVVTLDPPTRARDCGDRTR